MLGVLDLLQLVLRISSLSAEFNKLEFDLFDLLFQTLGVPHLLLQSRDEFHFALDLNVEALNSLVAGLDNVLAVLDFLFTFQNHLLVMRNSGILVAVVLLAVASGVVELGEHLLDEVVTVNACKHLLRLAGIGHELRDGGLRWRSLCGSSSGIRGRRFFSSSVRRRRRSARWRSSAIGPCSQTIRSASARSPLTS